MLLRSQTSERVESRVHRSCVECKSRKTPMWRSGPAGKNTLCNACGIRHRKLLDKLNSQGTAKKKKIKKPRTKRTRTNASISTAGSTTNPAAGNSTLTTANNVPSLAAAYGIVGGLRSRCTIKTVMFVVNNTTTVKKLRCYKTKRTSLLEEQLAVAALLELAGSALR